MGIGDKIENMKDKVVGEGKEQVGDVTDNERLEAEGKGQQTEGNLKQAGENVKDAFKN
ncbi:CsbD family protein [Knoellia sp. CPCC 206453]|uniref:CsbD family protein n=1 Tax=Knoellia pratensis TaxID=3404796 RepID=UPI00360B774F